jgi:hypothetical protein
LPAFESKITLDQSVKFAKSFIRAKYFAPTRSHPSAPAHTPYETVAALLAAPMDRLADLLYIQCRHVRRPPYDSLHSRSFPDQEERDEAHTLQREYMGKSKL